MSSIGFSAASPELITGWDSTSDCIRTTLKAELGAWPMRRDWGGGITDIIDDPQNQEVIIDFFYAVANALRPRLVRGVWYGEPRFHLEHVSVDASTPAVLYTTLDGIYFPEGHLGVFQRAERRSLTDALPIYSPTS